MSKCEISKKIEETYTFQDGPIFRGKIPIKCCERKEYDEKTQI